MYIPGPIRAHSRLRLRAPLGPMSIDPASQPLTPSAPRQRRRRWWRWSAAALVSAALLGACVLSPPDPGTYSLESRLEQFPTGDLELFGPAEVRWNDQAVPFVIAEDERDVPYLLGMLHGHLRRAQMEILRHIARGELSQMAGPFASEFDELLITLDLDRAVPQMEAELPNETRAWCERYVAGLNRQARDQRKRPTDARLLGLDMKRQWSVGDVLTLARLASVDISLGRTLGLLSLRSQENYGAYLAQVEAFGQAGIASFGPGQATPLGALEQLGRSGSNCFVVAPERSASGAALLAGDPHLGFFLPNFWCLVGYQTPERTVVGLTLPGVPAVALGRNDRIAWGGTNMAAYSSALYDVSELPAEEFTTRTEDVDVRLWFDRELTVRETSFGPVVTDLALLEDFDLPDLALRWRGHEASDEVSAFLRASHAEDWQAFRQAWSGYAVAGQNMLYADVDGHIGQVLALEQVPAAAEAGRALIADRQDPRFDWGPGTPSDELPAAFDPPKGYLVSANNHPLKTEPPITAGGNSNDRVARMNERIQELTPLDLEDLIAIQRDVVLPSGRKAAQALFAIAAETQGDSAFVRLVGSWDGSFDRNSKGAPAYRRWAFELLEGPYSERLGPGFAQAWQGSVGVHERLLADLESGWLSSEEVLAAGDRAAQAHDLEQTWGAVHRLPLRHPLGAIPWIGRGYRWGELEGDGTLGTVRKTAGAFTPEVHESFFGAQARHLHDMSDPDANYFVLLGGQDGWIGSANLIDQVELFEAGEFIQMPLRRETIEARFTRVQTLTPTKAP